MRKSNHHRSAIGNLLKRRIADYTTKSLSISWSASALRPSLARPATRGLKRHLEEEFLKATWHRVNRTFASVLLGMRVASLIPLRSKIRRTPMCETTCNAYTHRMLSHPTTLCTPMLTWDWNPLHSGTL